MTNEANIEMTGRLILIGFLVSIRNALIGIFFTLGFESYLKLYNKFVELS